MLLFFREPLPFERDSFHYLPRIQEGETLTNNLPELLAEVDIAWERLLWLIVSNSWVLRSQGKRMLRLQASLTTG
jgi:hypothetical protein